MSTAALLWGVLFGAVGAGYVMYGRRQRVLLPALCGGALVVVPYVLHNVVALVVVCACLAAAPWFFRP